MPVLIPTGPIILGVQGVVYRSTNGRATWASAANSYGFYINSMPPNSLVSMDIIRNVNITSPYKKADFSTRQSDSELTGAGLRQIGVELDIPWQPGDAGFQALMNSYVSRLSIPLVVFDQAITSAYSTPPQGWWADWLVADFPAAQEIDKEMISKVKITPTLGASGIAPQWVQL